MNSPKAAKDYQHNYKNTIKDLEQVCLKQAHDFLSCRPRPFYLEKFYLLDHSFAFYAQFLNDESRRKRLNPFKRFILLDSDNTFHITNFKTLNPAISSYETYLLYTLHSEVLSCV